MGLTSFQYLRRSVCGLHGGLASTGDEDHIIDKVEQVDRVIGCEQRRGIDDDEVVSGHRLANYRPLGSNDLGGQRVLVVDHVRNQLDRGNRRRAQRLGVVVGAGHHVQTWSSEIAIDQQDRIAGFGQHRSKVRDRGRLPFGGPG